MTLDELVASLRAGGGGARIEEFLRSNPNVTIDQLAASSLGWGIDDAAEPTLQELVRRQPENFDGHRHLANLYLRLERYEDSEIHFRKLIELEPGSPVGYRGLCFGYLAQREIGKLRDIINAAQSNITEGDFIDWQAGNRYLSEDTVSGMLQYIRSDRQNERDRRILNLPTGDPGAEITASNAVWSDQSSRAHAETRPALEIGTSGATLLGKVAADATRAEWRFEYGSSPETLERSTEWRPLPGPLSGKFTASPLRNPANFRLHAGEVTYEAEQAPALMCGWPFGKDPNHVSGIGFIELLVGLWHNSCQYDGYQTIQPWESSDLRDAELHVRLTVKNFNRKEFLHCIGVGNVNSYWFLTGEPLIFPPDKAEATFDQSFMLSCDPARWSTAGNNPDQAESDRYVYGPLSSALSRNVGNLVFVASFGDWRDGTTGSFGIDETVLRYRDNNILNNQNGADLIEHPYSTHCDALYLTNGERGEARSGWYHLGPVPEPLKFVWKLAEPLEISTFVFHQDRAMPAKRCRISVSLGSNDPKIWNAELPPLPDDTFPQPEIIARMPDGMFADTITLELLDGQSTEGLGLEAFVVFAKNFVPPPSREPVNVSVDIGDLEPGGQVFYRIQCRADEETISGEIRSLTVPKDNCPLLHHVDLFEQRRGSALVQVRGNAMNQKTTLQWKLDDKDWQDIPMGSEQTPVHRYITVRDVPFGDHSLTVRLVSDTGKSEKKQITWSALSE